MLYPINLRLEGRHCAVIGGGRTALRKTYTLLKAGAAVTVIAKKAEPELLELAQAGKLELRLQAVGESDFSCYFLVIIATDDEQVNRAAAEAAGKDGALVNMAAEPLELSDFELPAYNDCGEVLVTYSTGGKSPELARRLRERQAAGLACYAEWLEILAPYRSGLKKRLADSRQRGQFWRRVLDDEVLGLVEQGKLDEAEERIENALAGIGTES